jgi:fatty-acyl-CoA synthase
MAALLTDAFKWWSRSYPDRLALVFESESVTYGQLDAWTDRVAQHLAVQHDIGPGDLVAIAGFNSLEWCIAAVSILKTGAIITPFNYRYTVAELAQLIDNCSPALVLADKDHKSKVAAVDAGGNGPAVVSLEMVGQYAEGPRSTFVQPEISPSSPAIVAYTSGTTGTPKGVVYTHESVLWALFELMIKDPIPPDEACMLLALPLFTVAGIKHALVHMLARGGKLVVMKDFDPEQALELLGLHRVTQMNGVPVLWERMAAVPGFDDLDFSHIKVAMVGGARVSDSLLKAWVKRGVALRHMYGMTEAGGCGSVPRPEAALARPDLCGDGSIFTELKVVRPDGSSCDPGEAGEILMRGPAMMPCYWNNAEGTAELVVGGWIHSGDIGSLEANGQLRYVDRMKDMIISGGFNVSPTEVEHLISRHPGVQEVAVIAVPDEQWGEAGAAIVYADAPIDGEKLLALLRDELAVFKVPRYVVQTDEPLPRMPSGKIAKRQLRDDYADLPTR